MDIFIPRILEAIASGEEIYTYGNEVVLRRFQTGDRRHWSPKQWDVLDEFQQLFFTNFLLQYDNASNDIFGDYIDDIICMFALAGWPLTDLHEQVLSLSNDTLANIFFQDWATCHKLGAIWITEFWNKDQKKSMLEFYASKTLYDRMAAFGLDKSTEADISRKALFVADTIYYSRSWRD